MIRKLVCLLLLFALCAVGTAVSESTQITAGDWAFTHAPEESVLLLREDGTAVFKGQEYSWTGDGEFIRLAAEGGEEISLRFVTTEEKTLLYIPKEYVRLLIMMVLIAHHIPAIPILVDTNCILNKVEADMSHNTRISHMADINLSNFKIPILILFQVERKDAMSWHSEFLFQVFDALITELVNPIFVQKTTKRSITSDMRRGGIRHHIFCTFKSSPLNILPIEVKHLIGKMPPCEELRDGKFGYLRINEEPRTI